MSFRALRNHLWRARELARSGLAGVEDRLKPWRYRRVVRGRSGRLDVCIHARVGFFAQLNWVLMILAHCEAYGLRPRIELTGPFYADTPGEDWFAHFYDMHASPCLPDATERRICRIGDLSQLGLPVDYAQAMTLEQANALWNRTYSLRPEIHTHVESYIAQHFAGRHVLAVHFRGTDKTTEAPRVCWNGFARALEETLAARPSLNALFVASDEPAFIEYIAETFPGMPVIVHEDRVRSEGGQALHVQPTPGMNRDKARDALVNALLLSRCDALVRSASFLSGWASVFNPALPVTLLNRPYKEKLWFPDRAIVKRALNLRGQSFASDGSSHGAKAAGPG